MNSKMTTQQALDRGFKPQHSGADSPLMIAGMVLMKRKLDPWEIQIEGKHKYLFHFTKELDDYINDHSRYLKDNGYNFNER